LGTNLNKESIRSELKAKCNSLALEYRLQAATKVLQFVNPLLDACNSIAIFNSCNYEISLNPIIEYCISTNKKVYYPFAFRSTQVMQFREVKENIADLPIFFNAEIVARQETIEWYNIDLILLPLIAVDKYGNRLGRGGGYYDTTLINKPSSSTTSKCGVGFECQMVDEIPVDHWDVKLDFFASELGLVKF
jgi:5-formyltetrahydrofolate cyclo-ligase